ncbi:MAG: carbohydrate-binding protein, partial [Balneolaceae bacterium]
AKQMVAKKGGYVGYEQIDLSGIAQISVALSAGGRSGAVGGQIRLYLGSPEGELLDEVPHNGEEAGEVTLNLRSENREEITGFHDLYIVFENDQAREIDPLFIINEFGFINTTTEDIRVLTERNPLNSITVQL